jgi:hypothetical protein
VKQSRCKDNVLIRKYNKIVARARHMHLVLFEKAFPSSCQVQFMRTQML